MAWSDNCEEEIITALQNKDYALAAEKSKKYLEKLNNVPLNIAITGESGSGKSTLVNALRGIKNGTKEAAETGVTETTMVPTSYIHPEMPNITIWDLPGVGTTNFTADQYVKKMEFEKYDFFIIVSSERFRENDAKLAKEIEKMKKKFYFVRSKIDNNIREDKIDHPKSKEEEVLKIVRNNCTAELQKLGFKSSKVFLVAGHRLHLYEFKDLRKTLMEELPQHLRDVLVLGLPNMSLEAIEQKKKTLETKILWFTVTSTAVASAPVPGLSEAVDLGMITAFATHCMISLGLTPQSLQKLSDLSGVPLDDLKAELKSDIAGFTITTCLLLKCLTRFAAVITAMSVEEGFRFLPVVGTAIAMAISGVTTYKVLKYILDTLAEDAQRVFIKAWGQNTSG